MQMYIKNKVKKPSDVEGCNQALQQLNRAAEPPITSQSQITIILFHHLTTKHSIITW
jgi:hypothetical protein